MGRPHTEVLTTLFIFDHSLLLGLLLAIMLAIALDVGRQVAVPYNVNLTAERKEQMGTIRDGFFILLSLLLGFTLTFAASRFVRLDQRPLQRLKAEIGAEVAH